MSFKQNEEWLLVAQDNFDGAIAEENWIVAQTVIDDIRGAGFELEANNLRKALFVAQERYAELKDEAWRLAGGSPKVSQEKCIESTDCKNGYHSDQCPRFRDYSSAI